MTENEIEKNIILLQNFTISVSQLFNDLREKIDLNTFEHEHSYYSLMNNNYVQSNERFHFSNEKIRKNKMTENLPEIIERGVKNYQPYKEYSCCNGHQFNHDECNEKNICPYCWPNGFRNKPNNLQRGKYDINFAIGLLRQIEDHINTYKFSTNSDLVLSLSHTLKRMISHLEIERNLDDM